MLVEARYRSARPDRVLHHGKNSLETEWQFSRPMYMNNAVYDKANRQMFPWVVDYCISGNTGMMSNMIHWMYSSPPRTLKLDPEQIHTLYSFCFETAAPKFLGAAVKAAKEGNVTHTWDALENAEICTSKVGIPWDEEQAERLKRLSVELALQRVLVKVGEYSGRPVRDLSDYDRLCELLEGARSYAEYLAPLAKRWDSRLEWRSP